MADVLSRGGVLISVNQEFVKSNVPVKDSDEAEKKPGVTKERAMKEYGVIDMTIIHRIGVLPIGERASC